MNRKARRKLEEFQDELRDLAEKDELDYTNDSIYGFMIMLDSALRDGFTTAEAVNEFIQNSNLQIQTTAIETQVVNK